MLSDPERRVLEVHCFDHPVATCERCERAYKFADLAFDVLGRRDYACPTCRVHLDDALRLHILGCATIAGVVQERIARSKILMKLSEQIQTSSALLRAESEDLSRRVLETKRGSRVADGGTTVIERIMSALYGHRAICERCVADAARVKIDDIVKSVKLIREHLRLN